MVAFTICLRLIRYLRLSEVFLPDQCVCVCVCVCHCVGPRIINNEVAETNFGLLRKSNKNI